MASEALQAWIDNPPLAAPPPTLLECLLAWWPWLLLLLLVALLLRWRLAQPRQRLLRSVARLRRALLQGALDERQALFVLAQAVARSQLPPLPSALQQTLESRFHRSAPTTAALLSLLQQLQVWLRA